MIRLTIDILKESIAMERAYINRNKEVELLAPPRLKGEGLIIWENDGGWKGVDPDALFAAFEPLDLSELDDVELSFLGYWFMKHKKENYALQMMAVTVNKGLAAEGINKRVHAVLKD